MSEWTKDVDGTTYTAHATEIRPGVYEIADDLLDQLMRVTGWTPVPPPCRITPDGWCAEHATPSDDTAAMWIDPNPPGVTPLPPEQAREILDALDDTPSDPPQDQHDEWCPKNGCRCGRCPCGEFTGCGSSGNYPTPEPVPLIDPAPASADTCTCSPYFGSSEYAPDCPRHVRPSADTEGVRLTEDERQYLRSLVRDMFPTDYGRGNFEAWVEDAAQQAEVVVERIKADAYNAGLVEGANIGIHMRAATEGKGEA